MGRCYSSAMDIDKKITRTRIKALKELEASGTEVLVKGWVRTKRESKDLIFLEVNDGSCLSNIQAVIDLSSPEGRAVLEASQLPRLSTGASVAIHARLVASPGGKQGNELQPLSIQIIGEAAAEDYPLQKKRHSFEYLREIAHLRPRTNTFGAITRVRNRAAIAIHNFFQSRDFLWVHTPIITASDAEGAGEMFQVSTLPFDRISGAPDYSRDFFGKPAFLTVSGQLSAETYATALDRVYTFGPTFRAENSNTTRHLAEFWMVEPEVAFFDINDDMDLAEEFLKYLLKDILENCQEDMEFFDQRIQTGLIAQLQSLVDSEFLRISYTQAIKDLQAAEAKGHKFEFTPHWGADLQSEHEKYLTEQFYKGPLIVTDYPKEIKAFYMKLNEDGKTVRGMDLLVPRLGEIIGGSEREADLDTLKARMKEAGLDEEAYWWYLDLRRFGTVPHAGFGLGFERFIQYITGMQNIRDVIPFPRSPKHAEF